MSDSHSTPQGPNPSGLCMCGCGRPAPLATQGSTRFGWVNGKPMKYILGHRGKSAGKTPVCTVDGCTRPVNAQRMCSFHYSRWKAHGDPLVTLKKDLSLDDRFWSFVIKGMEGQCWEWTGGHTGSGYSAFSIKRYTQMPAHQYAYESLLGSIPEGLELDHLCRNRGCVNPDHLELVTHDENMKRADKACGVRSAATHCPQGHKYDEANTDHHNGRRHCRECARERR